MYDAIIIGAGISGLVCGCYLAKAGMKVLIAEQHYKPGGYCTSFKREGFTFDAAAHCFGGYRNDGMTRKVFEELEIDKRIRIIRSDPASQVIMVDNEVFFWANLDETVNSFRTSFQDESDNIRNFFQFLINPDPASFSRTRSWTFKDLLDKYFRNEKLKAILAAPLLGIGGLPPTQMSAFIAAKLFSEFLIDGGYYPLGGMQILSDSIAEKFKEFGGELRLSCLVKKIKFKDNKAIGIIMEKDGFVPSKYVVSNCDARQTFFILLDKTILPQNFTQKIKNMTPSLSDFVLYLGTDGNFESSLKPGINLCFFLHHDLNKAYLSAQKCDMDGFGGFLLHIAHDKSTILAYMPASYKNKRYWNNNKQKFLESLLDRIEKYTIPNLSEHIKYKEAATPQTLHRYTLNYKGAAFGWAGTPSQLADPELRKPPFIQGLYLTGHWATLGVGISGVVYVGYDTAKMILRKEKNKSYFIYG